MNDKQKIKKLIYSNKNLKWLIICCIVTILFLTVMLGYKTLLYDEAMSQGVDNTLTALQMVVACQNLSNVTIEDIQKRTIEMFILKEKEK